MNLYALVFGESVLNDAVSFYCFLFIIHVFDVYMFCLKIDFVYLMKFFYCMRHNQ